MKSVCLEAEKQLSVYFLIASGLSDKINIAGESGVFLHVADTIVGLQP